ncbi:hNH endonuclease [Klebsiella aerogenes]|uniref:hNH endonuclease n=1 Tax=Klebsiella aerogenes TaxID=548 RepID=UPI0021D036D3|nr:hNH endonuclease [Klebsiella aerogenes]
MNNEIELTAALATIEKCRELTNCPAGVDLQDWVKQLAAENLAQKNRTQQLIDIINNADNAYCMCGDAMKNHTYGGCGHPTGMFDYHYGKWLEHGNETPATDRIVAEAEARGVEKFAAKLRIPGDDQFFDAVAEGVAGAADAFAKQLREGADK